jgi:signal transduction histidine kinase
MADLFDSIAPAAGNADSYSAKDIEVLEGLEPVRRRPGMYVGGTDERALHHLAAEALDNAMDEAVAGHATRIELELDAEGWVTVRDNGRGIPGEIAASITDAGVGSGAAGLGLASVAQRIAAFYGDEGRLRVVSAPRVGTLVSIVLPTVPAAAQVELTGA